MAVSCKLSCIIFLIIRASLVHQSDACRFAELLQGRIVEGDPPHDRHCCTADRSCPPYALDVICQVLVSICSLTYHQIFAGPVQGRELLAFVEVNDTGKAEALATSAQRLKATTESIDAYTKKATPINIKDLVTPVGNYTDAAVFWTEATMVSKYLPGAIVYTIKSIPDLLEDARLASITKWDNTVAMAQMVRTVPLAIHAISAHQCCMHNTRLRCCLTIGMWNRTLHTQPFSTQSRLLSTPPSPAWLCVLGSMTAAHLTPTPRLREGEYLAHLAALSCLSSYCLQAKNIRVVCLCCFANPGLTLLCVHTMQGKRFNPV